MAFTNIRFTVRRRGGSLGGKTLEHPIPEFDWQAFKNAPNAEAFVRKAYRAEAQRLVRELHEEKSGTDQRHLDNLEALIARSLKFSREEVEDWCESRQWSNARFSGDRVKSIELLKRYLPLLSSSEHAFPEKHRARAAEIVADVADSKTDPVADYLFVKLTQPLRPEPDLDILDL